MVALESVGVAAAGTSAAVVDSVCSVVEAVCSVVEAVEVVAIEVVGGVRVVTCGGGALDCSDSAVSG